MVNINFNFLRLLKRGFKSTARIAIALSSLGYHCGPVAYAQDKTHYKNWGLRQIASQQAWRITKGRNDIIVAIIDTGIDRNHPQLNANMWVNRGEIGIDENGVEKSTNKKDDDGNGYIDDVNGYNFAGENTNISDMNGHGTHIAGIIKSIAPQVRFMILKYYDPRAKGADNLEATVKAINYACNMGAKIINYSGGGTEKSLKEFESIKKCENKNILFIAAAGNEKSNSDIKPFYPADYDLKNILSVTAVDQTKQILNSSNFGKQSVDIAAPGKDILSTWPGGGYNLMSGTSQATAFVSGVAALLYSTQMGRPNLASVINSLTKTNYTEKNLLAKTRSGTMIDGYRTLAIKDDSVNAVGMRVENSDTINKDIFTIH